MRKLEYIYLKMMIVFPRSPLAGTTTLFPSRPWLCTCYLPVCECLRPNVEECSWIDMFRLAGTYSDTTPRHLMSSSSLLSPITFTNATSLSLPIAFQERFTMVYWNSKRMSTSHRHIRRRVWTRIRERTEFPPCVAYRLFSELSNISTGSDFPGILANHRRKPTLHLLNDTRERRNGPTRTMSTNKGMMPITGTRTSVCVNVYLYLYPKKWHTNELDSFIMCVA